MKSLAPESVVNIPLEVQTGQSGWGFIDKVYCISLAHRMDRRIAAQTEFERVGLGDQVEFITSEKHPTNAEHGNFIAQMNALRAGLAAGAERIAVFEDDIVFERFSEQKLRRVFDFMRSGAQWNAFFFGCFVKSSRRSGYRSVVKVRFRSTTHGYAVNREFAERLVATAWPGRCLDDLLCSMNDCKMFAVYPAFAFQSNSPTDNDKQIWLDRIRRMLGGIRRLQKLNEFAARHRTAMVVIHTGIVLAAIGWGVVYFVHR